MFRKALELNPTYTEAYFNLGALPLHGLCIHMCGCTVLPTIGTLYIQMGKYEEAEVNLKHALQLNPEHYGAINNLKVLEYHRARSDS